MGFFVDYLTVGGGIAYAAEPEFTQPSTGSFAAAITGTGSVLKTGTGNLILSGSSIYTGATSVAAVGGRHSRRQPHRRARRGGTRRLRLGPGNGTLLTFTDFNNTPAPFVEDTTIFAEHNHAIGTTVGMQCAGFWIDDNHEPRASGQPGQHLLLDITE